MSTEFGLSGEQIDALADEMEVGDALRDAGLVFARQDYLTPDGLLALGAMLGLTATEAE